MTRITTTTTRLQRGESLHLPLDRFTTLEVDSGRVVVREPLHWLGETVVSPIVTLTHGESHRLARGGWVELQAFDGMAMVRSHRPLPAAHAMWLALRRLATRAFSRLRLASADAH